MIKNILSILLITLSLSGQTITNLNYFNSFVDSTINELSADLDKGESLFLNFECKKGEAYFLKLIQALLSRKGANLVFEGNKADFFLNYKVEEAEVTYPEMIKDGILADYSVKRELNYSGFFSLNSRNKSIAAKAFSFSLADTVGYGEINRIENPVLDFTKAELPEEPLWESLLEPAIAIGTIIVTVVLLFTVRSN